MEIVLFLVSFHVLGAAEKQGLFAAGFSMPPD